MTSADKFYDLPDTKTKRSAGIGIGQRCTKYSSENISKSKHSLSPNHYHILGEIQNNLIHKKGITFGLSRQQVKNSLPNKDWIPGQYLQISSRKLQTPIYSIKQVIPIKFQNLIAQINRQRKARSWKLQFTFHYKLKGKVYNFKIQEVCTNKQFFELINIKCVIRQIFSKQEFNRCIMSNQMPGPGLYEIRSERKLKLIISKYTNKGNTIMMRGKRPELKPYKGPGPGDYILPSDFGQPNKLNSIKRQHK